MIKLADMLVYLRKRNGLSQQALADQIGLTRSAIGMYETGKREPDLETLGVFADYYGVDLNTLTGRNGIPEQEGTLYRVMPMKQIPLVGRIACGEPILAEENIEAYVDLPRRIHADFALECKGDSMTGAGIRSGDMVYIKSQPEVENGQIAAVMVDGEEATLKRFYFDGRVVQLVAENPKFPPMVFVGEEIDRRLHIVGRAMAYTHAL